MNFWKELLSGAVQGVLGGPKDAGGVLIQIRQSVDHQWQTVSHASSDRESVEQALWRAYAANRGAEVRAIDPYGRIVDSL